MEKDKDILLNTFLKEQILPRRHKFLEGTFFCFLMLTSPIFVFSFFKPIVKIINSSFSINSIVGSSFILIALLYIIAIIVWEIFYGIKKIPDGKIGILLSLNVTNKKTEDEVKILKEKLRTMIKSPSLIDKNLELCDIPTVFTPKSSKDAHKLLKKFGAKVIIWGETEYGKIKSENNFLIKPIRFSHSLNLQPILLGGINNVISEKIIGSKWIVRENESIYDREYLVNNMHEICLWVIGITLFSNREYLDAYDFFHESINKIKSEDPDSENKPFIHKLIIFLIENKIYQEILNSQLYPNTKKDILNKSIINLKENIKTCEEFSLKYNSFVLKSYLSIAERDVPNAIKNANKAYELDKKDLSGILCLTYLNFYISKLDNGFKFLKMVLKNKGDIKKYKPQALEIIRWYDEALIEDPTKTFLNFPIGVFNFYFLGDRISSKNSLELFLSVFDGKEDRVIKKLIFESKKILKKIEKNK